MSNKYKPTKKRNKYSTQNAVIAAVIVIIIILVYIITLGNAKRKKEESLHSRHKRLKDLMQKKSKAALRVKKFNKRVYFWIRLLLSLGYISINIFCFFYLVEEDLGDLLNYNQVGIICFILLSFISFGNLDGLRLYIKKLKVWLEIKTYKKFEEDNIRHQKELAAIETEIKKSRETKTIKG